MQSLNVKKPSTSHCQTLEWSVIEIRNSKTRKQHGVDIKAGL